MRGVIIKGQSPKQRIYSTPKLAFLPIFAVFWGFLQFQEAVLASRLSVGIELDHFRTITYIKIKMGILFNTFKFFAYSPPNGPLCTVGHFKGSWGEFEEV